MNRLLRALNDGDKEEWRFIDSHVPVSISKILEQSSGWNKLDSAAQQQNIRTRRRIVLYTIYMLGLPEEEVDIFKVAMTLLRDAEPATDINHYGKEFDKIVELVQKRTPFYAGPELRVRALNTVLYQELGFRYDKKDPLGKQLLNRYVAGVLETRKGSCLNLATTYIALAQRLGYPVYAVAAPHHLFARYVDPEMMHQNIDPAGMGGWDSDEEYVRRLEIPARGIKNGAYLRTMTHKELAAELILDHAWSVYFKEDKDHATAVALMLLALRNSPWYAEGWGMLGDVWADWGRYETNRSVQETQFVKALYYYYGAERIGNAKMSEEYIKKALEAEKSQVEPGI